MFFSEKKVVYNYKYIALLRTKLEKKSIYSHKNMFFLSKKMNDRKFVYKRIYEDPLRQHYGSEIRVFVTDFAKNL